MHSADMMKYMNFGVVGSIVLTVLVAANVGVPALIVGIVTVVFMGLYIYNFYLAKQVYESIQNGINKQRRCLCQASSFIR